MNLSIFMKTELHNHDQYMFLFYSWCFLKSYCKFIFSIFYNELAKTCLSTRDYENSLLKTSLILLSLYFINTIHKQKDSWYFFHQSGCHWQKFNNAISNYQLLQQQYGNLAWFTLYQDLFNLFRIKMSQHLIN